MQKTLLFVSALLESGAGLLFVALPVMAGGLLGASLAGELTVLIARLFGAAILVLGVLCWVGASETGTSMTWTLVAGLVAYHLLAALLVGLAADGGVLAGTMPWAIAATHAVLGVGLAATLFRSGT